MADTPRWQREASEDRVIDLAGAERGTSSSWTIDLTSLEPAPEPAAPTTLLRRRGMIVGTLLVVCIIMLAALATVSYRRGTAWRDIALDQRARGAALEQQLTAAREAVARADASVEAARAARDAAVAANEEATGRLRVSEQDVAELEARIAQLASEKARLEDDVAVAGRLSQSGASVEAALTGCVMDVQAWLAVAPHGHPADRWEAWSRDGDRLRQNCDAALASTRG